MPFQSVPYAPQGVYQPRYNDSIAMLMARGGDIAARGAERSGEIWGNTISTLGGIASEAIGAHQEQSRLKKQDAAFLDLLDSPIWGSDPVAAAKGVIGIYGPRKGSEILRGVSGSMGLKASMTPEQAMSHLPDWAAGFVAATPEVRKRTWPAVRDLLAKTNLPGFTDTTAEWDEARLPEVAMFVKPKEPVKPEIRVVDGVTYERAPGSEWAKSSLPAEATKPEARSIDAQLADAKLRGDEATYAKLLRVKAEAEAAGRAPTAPVVDTLGKVPDEWRSVIDRSILMIPATRRKSVLEAMSRAWASGNVENIKSLVKQAAVEGENVDKKNQVQGREATIAALKDVETILLDLNRAKVPTGWLAGNVEDLYRKLGTSTNPEYVSLGARLKGVLIDYRRAATGVQFSERESADYEQMFPNYRNTLPVNLALIRGLMRQMETHDKTYWESKLGKEGAQLVGVTEGGASAPAAPRTYVNPKTGQRIQWNGTSWVPVQ